MLIEFKVSNFKSFLEEQTLSLVASNYEKELSEHLIAPELPGMKKAKLLRGAAIYGANASGKSNLIQALDYLKRRVLYSIRFSSRDPEGEPSTGVTPFKLIPEDLRPEGSEFKLAFILDGIRFEFLLSLSPLRVLRERLAAFPKGREQVWYDREFDESTKTDRWTHLGEHAALNSPLESRTRPDALFLSVAYEFNHFALTPVQEWFRTITVIGEAFLSLNRFMPSRRASATHSHRRAIEACMQDDAHKMRVLRLLKSADLGVSDLTVKQTLVPYPVAYRLAQPASPTEPVPQVRELLELSLTHSGHEDFEAALDWETEESLGTKQLYALLGPWLETLDCGGVILVDEVESSLHPILVRELLKMFLHRGESEAPAQIIFTTHNPLLLDQTLLRRDQVWFTEKDSRGMTHLYPLSDYSPRKDESLPRGYMAGRYGAIPSIPDGFAK